MAGVVLYRTTAIHDCNHFFSGEKLSHDGSIRDEELDQDVDARVFLGLLLPDILARYLVHRTATILAFPASYALAFKTSDTVRRWAIFFLIIPFFTSYLVRTFSWYVILAESGALNAVFSWFGIGPFTMLNTPFGTIVGYMTLTLPLVVVLQTSVSGQRQSRPH